MPTIDCQCRCDTMYFPRSDSLILNDGQVQGLIHQSCRDVIRYDSQPVSETRTGGRDGDGSGPLIGLMVADMEGEILSVVTMTV